MTSDRDTAYLLAAAANIDRQKITDVTTERADGDTGDEYTLTVTIKHRARPSVNEPERDVTSVLKLSVSH